MHDFYLIDIGWLFFGAWGAVVAVVTYKAFAPDLFQSRDRSRKLNAAPINRSEVR